MTPKPFVDIATLSRRQMAWSGMHPSTKQLSLLYWRSTPLPWSKLLPPSKKVSLEAKNVSGKKWS
jgi:hypothetical protein